ncbi:hypothetical protein A2U01_0117953, partial [Trifolium medium]|nr:hypothetical protein [Trifolium medium]
MLNSVCLILMKGGGTNLIQDHR